MLCEDSRRQGCVHIIVMMIAATLYGKAGALEPAQTDSSCAVFNDGQRGIVRTMSAYTLGKTGFSVGGAIRGGGDYDYVVDPVTTANGTAISRATPIMVSADLFIAYGLRHNWDIALSMPFYYDRTGWQVNQSGRGDLELSTKLADSFFKENALVSLAYFLKISVPTGSAGAGFFPRHAYYFGIGNMDSGNDLFNVQSVLVNPMLLWTLDFGRLTGTSNVQLHVNFGGVFIPAKSVNAMVAAIGAEYTPIRPMTLFGEVSAESRVSWYTQSFSLRNFDNDAVWITPGIRVNVKRGIYAQLAGDFGVSERSPATRTFRTQNGYHYGTAILPKYSAHFSVVWSGILKKPGNSVAGRSASTNQVPVYAGSPAIVDSAAVSTTTIATLTAIDSATVFTPTPDTLPAMLAIDSSTVFTTLAGPLPKVIKADRSPYLAIADIEVPADRTITIEPGAVIMFKNFTGLHVYGRLVAEGTGSNPIILTSEYDRSVNLRSERHANPYDWNGIYIHPDGFGTRIAHCKVLYAVYGLLAETKFIRIDPLTLKHCGKQVITIGNVEQKPDDKGDFRYVLSVKDATVDGVPVDILKDPQARKRNIFRYTGLVAFVGGCAIGTGQAMALRQSQATFATFQSDTQANMFRTPAEYRTAQKARNVDAALTWAGFGMGLLGAIGFGWTFMF
jgi:hypothetical protein